MNKEIICPHEKAYGSKRCAGCQAKWIRAGGLAQLRHPPERKATKTKVGKAAMAAHQLIKDRQANFDGLSYQLAEAEIQRTVPRYFGRDERVTYISVALTLLQVWNLIKETQTNEKL